MKQLNQRIFKIWIGLWVIILMIPTIFNQVAWLPLGLLVAFSAFLLWWGLTQVCSKVDWNSSFDWGMAYVAITFFGSMMAFLLPYSYGFEQSLSWNNWCQIFTLIWLLSIIVALILTLKEGWSSLNNWWKSFVVTLLVLFIGIFIISLLGMCGIYLV
jgi:NAD/NADP transhydrogenase beta subunit